MSATDAIGISVTTKPDLRLLMFILVHTLAATCPRAIAWATGLSSRVLPPAIKVLPPIRKSASAELTLTFFVIVGRGSVM